MKKKFYRLKKNKKGYPLTKKKSAMHSKVAENRYGKLPEGFVVHHIDGDKNNFRKKNLIVLHRKDHYRVHAIKDLKIENLAPKSKL
jgi:hypothetical protein